MAIGRRPAAAVGHAIPDVDQRGPDPPGPGGALEVEWTGVAFALLRRSVIERMISAHPELIYKNVHGQICWALFQHVVKDGWFCGEDVSFCRRWSALGGRMWLLPDASFIHEGPVGVEGNLWTRLVGEQAPDAPKPRTGAWVASDASWISGRPA